MRTFHRGMELERQKEIIETWLDTPGIPADAHRELVEMLTEVIKELACGSFRDDGTRLAS